MKTTIHARNAEIDTLGRLLNGGFMTFYTGPQPLTPEYPLEADAKALATLRFGNPAFSLADMGTAWARPIAKDPDAAATGKATWFRCYKADGQTAILDGSVGTAGADINFKSTDFQQHTEISLDSFSITLPQ